MRRVILILSLLAAIPGFSQTPSYQRTIAWGSMEKEITGNTAPTTDDTHTRHLRLQSWQDRDLPGSFPVYNELIFAPGYYPNHRAELSEMQFVELEGDENEIIRKIGRPENLIETEQQWMITRGKPALRLSFVPIRENPLSGRLEKLVSFSIRFAESHEQPELKQGTPAGTFPTRSVLAQGQWVKIKTTEDGIYRLTYNDIVQMGFSNPSNIRIYGNGNLMLPKIAGSRSDYDLNEIGIYKSYGQGGTFGPGDYILFYGQGPVSWEYDEVSGFFEHRKHSYSDGSYYFITSSASGGKPIITSDQPPGEANVIIEEFDDYGFHEQDLVNLLKSGRQWFGEHFRVRTTYGFSFNFPETVPGSLTRVKWQVASRSPVPASFTMLANSQTLQQLNMTPVNIGSYVTDYASVREGITSFTSSGNQFELTVNYSQNTPSAEGWLDYILVNVVRNLRMTGDQMHFRNAGSKGDGNIARFNIKDAPVGIRVWDITKPTEPVGMVTDMDAGILSFKDETTKLKQYIAFSDSQYLEPEVIGPAANQNLHATGPTDMVIITHPEFLSQANQLASHRQINDDLSVLVLTPQQVYNEFSSGKPDITAFRDFMKMLYDRAGNESEMPSYLLLFGKGSYDNRPGDPSGTNFIPTYQSPNSLRPTQSFVSDDYFGLLDDGEGEFEGLIDIGIGRLPVTTQDQAQAVVNKILGYNTPARKGDWQMMISFIADDGDNNIHMRDADLLAEGVKENYPAYNIEKIYLDAWPKTGTSLGQRYPGVNRAISERIDKGALIINYTGHGNDLRLADENIIDINDVSAWTNRDRLPVFMTATCEFSRFDNPERVSAGEMALLNPRGGGIALFSTTRLVYATPNFHLNQNFYRFVLEALHNGSPMRLGDIMRLTKINTGSGINKRNFTLLGDPSMELAIPRQEILITSVNESAVNEVADTLRALSKVSVSGIVIDQGGNPDNSFNGVVYQTVYDKELVRATLGNDGATPFSFTARENIVYKGKSTVTSGSFDFTFIVPKDINYHFGRGRISTFAREQGGSRDAAGSFENVIIGGSNPDAPPDNEGPEIELFMNDRNFVSGGTTGPNPRLLAFLSDSSGINTVGSGIGHDLTLTVNNDPSTIIVLNDYYVADADSYQSGTVEYQFNDLEEGRYNLKLKAWDVYNNSSESGIDFTVTSAEKLTLSNVFNYPNPFTERTFFHFEHNRPGAPIDILIQIFTVSGRLVKTIEAHTNTPGFKPDPVLWNGLDDFGDRIGRGVYIYRLRVRTDEGETAEKYEKLVILK